MQVTGTVKAIGDLKKVTDSFKKRELILTTEADTNYPQSIMIEFVQDKTDLLNNLKVGQYVNVDTNLQGREWTSPQGEVKYFNSLKGWRIAVVEAAPVDSVPTDAPSEDSDLPF